VLAFGNLTVQASLSLVMCGAGTGGVGPLVLGRLAGPDRVGLAAGDPERHRPARLDGDLGRLPLVGGGAVDLLAAVSLAEGGAAGKREAGGIDVKQRQAQMAYRAGGSRLTGSTVWPAMACVCRFQREKGPTPDGGRPRTWQMTGLRA
jgi:hypothetical protein